MNKRFIKNIISDLLITWPLIAFGLIMKAEYFGLDLNTGAQVIMWMIVSTSILGSFTVFKSEDAAKNIAESMGVKRTDSHKQYQFIGFTIETFIIFSAGYYWLGSASIIGGLCLMSMHSKLEEKL